MNFLQSILWYGIAYFIITLIGVLHTLFNGTVLHMEFRNEKTESLKDIEAYAKTMPFHPLYNIVIFPVFAGIYFARLTEVTLQMALLTGILWGVITVIIDYVGWIVIPHPWRCTYKDFYVDYQPWLTIIYITICISPLLAYLLNYL
jgi:hypothetical protein